MKNNIETEEHLEEFIRDKEAEIEKLCAERKMLNSKIYKLLSGETDSLRKRRDSLTTEIKKLRKDLKTAIGVRKRKDEIEEKLAIVNEMKKEKVVSKKVSRSR